MDLEATRGDTSIYNVQVIRQNVGINLAGVKIWFTAKNSKDDPDDDAVIAKNSIDDPGDFPITDQLHGKLQVRLNPADTSSFVEDRALYYDLQIKESSGVVTTVAQGILRVIEDVTYAYV